MYGEKFRLDGRVAVVTGGGGGIGLACVEALAEHGATVVIADRDCALADAARAGLKDRGWRIDVRVFDVTRSAEVDALAADVLRDHGRVDVLVACAGIDRSGTAAEDVSDADWLAVNDVNYNGVFWCNRAFGRPMLEARSGSIINIGSMSGLIVNRPQKQSYYNASKAAVHHMTKSLAAEWGDRGVRVNAVAPTYIETPMTLRGATELGLKEHWLRDTPMNRMGRPDEVASVVHFLACDASSLMTGAVVVVDAGLTCW